MYRIMLVVGSIFRSSSGLVAIKDVGVERGGRGYEAASQTSAGSKSEVAMSSGEEFS